MSQKKTSDSKCAGCPNIYKNIAFLSCSRCQDNYHYSCVNYNKEDYLNLPRSAKDNWICPSCRCKEPKIGDNTNTPIRSTSGSSKSSPSDKYTENITLRTKSNIVQQSKKTCTCTSLDSIREILRDELERSLKVHFQDIRSQLETFESSLTFLSAQFDSISKVQETQKQKLAQQQKEIDYLRESNLDLSTRLRQMDQLSRSSNIEIQCVPENKNESLLSVVQQLGRTIKCTVNESDIHYASRIAKHDSSSPRPRSILVKFSSPRIRDTFLANTVKFNRENKNDKLNSSHLGMGGAKKQPIYVSEHLSPENKNLHAATRRKAKELNYKYVWVRDGKIFIRKTDDSRYILVRDQNTLNDLK